jgi:hypothetical protein
MRSGKHNETFKEGTNLLEKEITWALGNRIEKSKTEKKT